MAAPACELGRFRATLERIDWAMPGAHDCLRRQLEEWEPFRLPDPASARARPHGGERLFPGERGATMDVVAVPSAAHFSLEPLLSTCCGRCMREKGLLTAWTCALFSLLCLLRIASASFVNVVLVPDPACAGATLRVPKEDNVAYLLLQGVLCLMFYVSYWHFLAKGLFFAVLLSFDAVLIIICHNVAVCTFHANNFYVLAAAGELSAVDIYMVVWHWVSSDVLAGICFATIEASTMTPYVQTTMSIICFLVNARDYVVKRTFAENWSGQILLSLASLRALSLQSHVIVMIFLGKQVINRLRGHKFVIMSPRYVIATEYSEDVAGPRPAAAQRAATRASLELATSVNRT